MGFVQNSKIRTAGRVRVTKRLVSDKDHRGRQTILAREGEEMSAAEAYRRGIAAKHVEGVGPSGQVAVDALRQAHRDDDHAEQILDDALTAAADAERAANQAGDAARAARLRGEVDVFPVERGGGLWILSDGSQFEGDADAAAEAQAALTGPAGDDGASAGDAGGDQVPDGNMTDVTDWVGDDPARAAAAIEAEKAKGDKARPTLIEALEKVAADGGS